MNNKLTKLPIWPAAGLALSARNCAAAGVQGGNDFNLNLAPGLADAWLWIPIAIVAMLLVFLGGVIIMAELHYRPNKILNKTRRCPVETPRKSFEFHPE